MAWKVTGFTFQVQKGCHSNTSIWFSVLDSCQHIEFWGGTAFFSCGIHVCGLHLLEFLSVHNYEQVILNLKLNLMKILGKQMLNDSTGFNSNLELQMPILGLKSSLLILVEISTCILPWRLKLLILRILNCYILI